MGDYPKQIVTPGHIEPVPRRIRAVLGGEVVFDTTKALYVWEWPNYPQYYIPVGDVRPTVLVDEQHSQQLRFGTARQHGLRAGDVSRPAAARVYTDDARDGLAGTVRFDWGALDAWFEEDEEVFVHPAAPTRASTRCGPPVPCGSSSTGPCWPSRPPRCWSSRPACRPATTSTAPK